MNAQQVANYFLDMSHEEDWPISQLKLLKLVYIGYGWVAAVLERKLFEEEIEAWKHGPVVPSLYHEFKWWGSAPIEGHSMEVDLDDPDKREIPRIPKDETDVQNMLSLVWGIYKRYSAWSLVKRTHEENTPWSETWERGQCKPIPYERIKTHFQRKIEEYLDAAERIARDKAQGAAGNQA